MLRLPSQWLRLRGYPAIHTPKSSILTFRFLQQSRPLVFSFRCQTTATSKPETNASKISPNALPDATTIYYGPMTPTFRRLKIFSLSSLAFSVAFVPFTFVVESQVPLAARLALASTFLITSGTTTAIMAWCVSPYVTTMRRLDLLEGSQGLEMTTLTLFLRERFTRVYDSEFLVPTSRFFAKWQLAEDVPLPTKRAGQDRVLLGQEETVAETLDDKGGVVGRWIVTWGANGGKCRAIGKVVRCVLRNLDILKAACLP